MDKNEKTHENIDQAIIWLFIAGILFILVMNLFQMAEIGFCKKFGGVLLDTGECVIVENLPYCLGHNNKIYEQTGQVVIKRNITAQEFYDMAIQ